MFMYFVVQCTRSWPSADETVKLLVVLSFESPFLEGSRTSRSIRRAWFGKSNQDKFESPLAK